MSLHASPTATHHHHRIDVTTISDNDNDDPTMDNGRPQQH